LDRYSDAGIDDATEAPDISAAARRAAERQMDRRDRTRGAGRGQRAARRSNAPDFLLSDDMGDDEMDEDLGLATMKRRTRRQYDERQELDDLDGVEDVCICFFWEY